MSSWWQHGYHGGPMVPVPGECIQGRYLQGNGYSRETIAGARVLGHRIAWERVHGPIPEGMHIHHTCGNRACVNVEHLELHDPRSHNAEHRRCNHADRYVTKDGKHSRCRLCTREKERARDRERYRTDPEYRERTLRLKRERWAKRNG